MTGRLVMIKLPALGIQRSGKFKLRTGLQSAPRRPAITHRRKFDDGSGLACFGAHERTQNDEWFPPEASAIRKVTEIASLANGAGSARIKLWSSQKQ